MDLMFACSTKSINKCLVGRCPSILDDVPGLRSSYSVSLI